MSTEPAPLTAVAGDHLAAYHHPHFVSVEIRTTGWGVDQAHVTFRGFNGTEPEPERPAASYHSAELTEGDRALLQGEYDALCTAWGIANFKHRARPLVSKAAPVWKAYALARKELEAVFAHFWEADDVQWKRQTLRLTDAHTEIRVAARAWDDVAEELAQLQADHLRTVGEEKAVDLADLGSEFGTDLSNWHIEHISAYRNRYYRTDAPLARETEELIEQQKKRLREVADLVGDR